MFLISELRYIAAIKIVSTKHNVVCTQNLVSDTILLYKQYKFCEKQKELTDKCQTKVILYPFPRCFQDKYRIFPRRVTDKRHSRQPSPLPPPPPPLNVQLTFLVGKIDMCGFAKGNVELMKKTYFHCHDLVHYPK